MFLRNMAWIMYTDEKLTVMATAIHFELIGIDIKGAKQLTSIWKNISNYKHSS